MKCKGLERYGYQGREGQDNIKDRYHRDVGKEKEGGGAGVKLRETMEALKGYRKTKANDRPNLVLGIDGI